MGTYFNELITAIENWADAKKDADIVREQLRGNQEAGYYWDRSHEREVEGRALSRLEKSLDAYVDYRIRNAKEG